ncbi:hypothetical protein BN14_06798 [Rhizoctonia solani AG-1 IB]|uniref:Uncharacterized protein n=1 Tax=Thanatephorus cucumeris (strain AG1-IB / isolate 7/3/14) TaxID=1108050 RepID=M5C174_THACB|nr:hypothetical protein BN14_06798 [Rhizoctonia solani AG-1 IB]
MSHPKPHRAYTYSSSSSSLSSSFPAVSKRDPHPSCNPPSIAFPPVTLGAPVPVPAAAAVGVVARDMPISLAPIARPATPFKTCIPTPPPIPPIPIPTAAARLENMLMPVPPDNRPALAPVPESKPTP